MLPSYPCTCFAGAPFFIPSTAPRKAHLVQANLIFPTVRDDGQILFQQALHDLRRAPPHTLLQGPCEVLRKHSQQAPRMNVLLGSWSHSRRFLLASEQESSWNLECRRSYLHRGLGGRGSFQTCLNDLRGLRALGWVVFQVDRPLFRHLLRTAVPVLSRHPFWEVRMYGLNIRAQKPLPNPHLN